MKTMARLSRGEALSFEVGAQLPADAATAEMIRKLLRARAPSLEGFIAERHALLATAVLGEKPGGPADSLMKEVREHRWQEAQTFRKWQGNCDNIEVYVVRATDGRVAVITALSPAELYVDADLVECDCLSAEAARELQATVELEWRSMTAS